MGMFTYPTSRAAWRRGFTLVEILVIAALIGLFSTIAIFSTQYLVDSSKRKSTIMDLRTIGNTLAIVKMDFSLFPKVGYLCFSGDLLRQMGRSNPETLFYGLPPDFDTVGFFETSETVQREGAAAKRVLEAWLGPYLPSSRGRALIGTRGFTVRMRMPTRRVVNGVQQDPVILDWPADPWGNPYVVYLAKLAWDEPSDQYLPGWITKTTEEASYKALVVSYGPNGVPGGWAERTRVTLAQKVLAEHFKLYKKDGNDFVALLPDEYYEDNDGNPQNRLAALENKFLIYPTVMGDPRFPGIIDPDSDDLFYEIPSK